jgi:hypothetical protein
MRKSLFMLLLACALAVYGNAQTARHATHIVPNGKGWGVESPTGISPAEAPPESCGGYRERH